MRRIVRSVDLPVPADSAWDAWNDIGTFPEFLDHVERVTVIDDTHSTWELKAGGVDWEFDALVTSSEPGSSMAWSTTGGEITLTGAAEFEMTTASTSRLTVTIIWLPEGVLEHLGAFFNDDGRILADQLEKFATHVQVVSAARR